MQFLLMLALVFLLLYLEAIEFFESASGTVSLDFTLG
jgi:hypothetical protein